MEARSSEADPALGQLISAVVARAGVQRIAPSHTVPFEALVRAVVYQSVSGKSAATIFARLKQAITGTLSPARILGLPQSTLTAAGLSTSKSTTIHRLAEWFEANSTIARQLPDLPYEGVISALIGIPGIGAWTVSVLLIFNFGRLDVIPVSDQGIRRGVQLVYRVENPATPKQVQEKSAALATLSQHRIDLSVAGGETKNQR